MGGCGREGRFLDWQIEVSLAGGGVLIFCVMIVTVMVCPRYPSPSILSKASVMSRLYIEGNAETGGGRVAGALKGR